MSRTGDILAFLNEIAPVALAESWDNVGLLAGSASQTVTRAVVSLDITPEICAEAEAEGAQLIVSHHPVIFKPLKAVLPEGDSRAVYELLRRGLTAICMHTNLDIARGGVNDALAEALGFGKTEILLGMGKSTCHTVTVFVPKEDAPRVRDAMTAAGAGSLGYYTGCTFEAEGVGRFHPLEGAKPYIGRPGEDAQADEVRIEAVCADASLDAVLTAVRRSHPYETPAIEVTVNDAAGEPYGLGRVAELPGAVLLEEFARGAVRKLGGSGSRLCAASGMARRIALCGGAWDDDLTRAALRAGADTILTGEMKHSQMLEALAAGLNVVAAGHFVTENVICARLAAQLSDRFADVSFRVAQKGRSPEYFMV